MPYYGSRYGNLSGIGSFAEGVAGGVQNLVNLKLQQRQQAEQQRAMAEQNQRQEAISLGKFFLQQGMAGKKNGLAPSASANYVRQGVEMLNPYLPQKINADIITPEFVESSEFQQAASRMLTYAKKNPSASDQDLMQNMLQIISDFNLGANEINQLKSLSSGLAQPETDQKPYQSNLRQMEMGGKPIWLDLNAPDFQRLANFKGITEPVKQGSAPARRLDTDAQGFKILIDPVSGKAERVLDAQGKPVKGEAKGTDKAPSALEAARQAFVAGTATPEQLALLGKEEKKMTDEDLAVLKAQAKEDPVYIPAYNSQNRANELLLAPEAIPWARDIPAAEVSLNRLPQEYRIITGKDGQTVEITAAAIQEAATNAGLSVRQALDNLLNNLAKKHNVPVEELKEMITVK